MRGKPSFDKPVFQHISPFSQFFFKNNLRFPVGHSNVLPFILGPIFCQDIEHNYLEITKKTNHEKKNVAKKDTEQSKGILKNKQDGKQENTDCVVLRKNTFLFINVERNGSVEQIV